MARETTAEEDAPILLHDDEVVDLDPAEWLAGKYDTPDDEIGYYVLPNGKGRIKLAAITDAEEGQIRVASTRLNVKNPKGPRVLDQNKYRRNMIASSINKAICGKLDGPVSGDQIAGRFSGQVAKAFEAVTKASGFEKDEDDTAEQATEVFV